MSAILDRIDKRLLRETAGLHSTPIGAYNIRKNGAGIARESTANIEITSKADQSGIEVIVKPGTKNESVHIPVILSAEGFFDVVTNTFDIGEESDILVVAGCGVHNPGSADSRHDGIHEFLIRKGARMRYVEKHYGEGQGKRILNPVTVINVEEGGVAELELVQIRGVDSTNRETKISLSRGARLIVTERLLTNGEQDAVSRISVDLVGDDSTARVISRSVARDKSSQVFYFGLIGRSRCRGHVQCDSIIMNEAQVRSIPEISAYHCDAQLVHEAAIGRIAGEQLLKLMSLGLTQEQAESTILDGFLK
jgi:Fe-S cluster assembly scaffold protein SufB